MLQFETSHPKNHPDLRYFAISGALLQADIITYNALMNAFAKSQQWQGALLWLQTASKHALQPTTVSYTTAITALRQGSQWQLAFELLDHSWTLPTYNACISAVAAEWQQATFGTSKDCCCTKPLIHFKSKLLFQSYWLKQLALDNGFTDTYHCHPVIHCVLPLLCRAVSTIWFQALCLLAALDSADLQPDLVTFNALLTSCEKAAAWRWALAVLQGLGEHELKPDTVSVNAAISAWG